MRLVAITGLGVTIDPFARKDNEYSVDAWNREHMGDLDAYARYTYPRTGEAGAVRDLLSKPYLARTVIENFVTPSTLRDQRVVDYYRKVGDCITVVFGRRRHWKTITTWDKVHQIWSDTVARGRPRQVYAVGTITAKPWFAKIVPTLKDVPNNSIVVYDEGAGELGARTTQTGEQRSLPGELAVAGQNKLLLFFISQNTSLTDKSILTLADAMIVKPTSFTQGTTERGTVGHLLRSWKEVLPREKWESVLFSSDMAPTKFERPIPSWWEKSLSYTYAKIQSQAEAIELASQLRESRLGWGTIATRMRIRGWRADDKTWKRWILDSNDGDDPAGRSTEARIAA